MKQNVHAKNMRNDGNFSHHIQTMSIRQAAEFLGYSIKTLYKKNSLNEIPYYNPTGKKVIYLRHELVDWIKNGFKMENHFTRQYFGS
ncbi:helix-turn-helix domain-containing protein [Kaistella sp. PBT33-4]|uniref:helix-turn-helix transcriptional regulator n=1 Tax=Kaistella sp. PBT33-4 TaxID=3032000 RepID=UPI0023D845F0|nr:helix-turn-helix domain-containing protein [Kaistella sp. PBT33-4]MDF0718932.1 helix-turn-helix domain-containing protein [Kaistella sp. PBT33-4]